MIPVLQNSGKDKIIMMMKISWVVYRHQGGKLTKRGLREHVEVM